MLALCPSVSPVIIRYMTCDSRLAVTYRSAHRQVKLAGILVFLTSLQGRRLRMVASYMPAVEARYDLEPPRLQRSPLIRMMSTYSVRLAVVNSRQQVDGRNITYLNGFDGMIFVFARRRLASASEMGDVVLRLLRCPFIFYFRFLLSVK